MDPKLNEQLQQILAALLANAQDAAAWAKGQIPILVQEKITLGRVEGSVEYAMWAVPAMVVLYFSVRYWKRTWALTVEYDAPVVLVNLVGFAFAGINLTPSHQLLTAWFAPRLYIVEWLMAQVHK